MNKLEDKIYEELLKVPPVWNYSEFVVDTRKHAEIAAKFVSDMAEKAYRAGQSDLLRSKRTGRKGRSFEDFMRVVSL